KGLAVGTRDACARPGRIGAVAVLGGAASTYLVAPMFAAVIVTAVDQIFRGRAERIVRLAERRDLAVAVIVDTDIQPDFRHPLRMSHRAGPGADHFLRRAPAAIDDPERVDQLAFPIGLAARLVPGERGERRKYRAHVVLLHGRIAIGRLHAPKREQRAALD